MYHRIVIFLCVFCCFACQQKESFIQNTKLIGFKSVSLSELDDEKYDSLKIELDKKHIDIRYINDVIYISHLRETDACSRYKGNIEFKGDTIKLMYELVSDTICTSLVINKLTYLIDNPQKTKYKIKIKQ
jgi:hypothetical protein